LQSEPKISAKKILAIEEKSKRNNLTYKKIRREKS